MLECIMIYLFEYLNALPFRDVCGLVGFEDPDFTVGRADCYLGAVLVPGKA